METALVDNHVAGEARLAGIEDQGGRNVDHHVAGVEDLTTGSRGSCITDHGVGSAVAVPDEQINGIDTVADRDRVRVKRTGGIAPQNQATADNLHVGTAGSARGCGADIRVDTQGVGAQRGVIGDGEGTRDDGPICGGAGSGREGGGGYGTVKASVHKAVFRRVGEELEVGAVHHPRCHHAVGDACRDAACTAAAAGEILCRGDAAAAKSQT